MTNEKKARVANAVGFLSGVLACLDAARDVKAWWPPDALWQGLRHPQRLEFAAGIALIVVTIVVSVIKARTARKI